MSNIKDFFYYNRKVIGVISSLLLLYLGTLFLNKQPKIIEEKPSEVYLMVDIKGEIKNPGVYKVKDESRIIDVIEISGGLLELADITSINLSEKVTDEMLIFIPRKEEFKIEEEKEIIKKEIINEKISINLANLSTLMKIKGIGQVKAQSIIDYRIKNGRYKKLEDLMKVKGIGKATFDKIKDNIKL